MNNFYLVELKSLWTKEITRFLRIWVQTLIPPVITVLLYFVIFGNLIGQRIGDMGGVSYIQFIVPGLIMMSIITSAYSNVCSSFFSAKFQRNIEELLIAPVPTHIIIIGYMGGGMVRSVLIGVIVTIISLLFTSFTVHNVAVIILTMLFTAMLFSLAGLLNGILATSFDDISIVPTFVLTPLTYLGGVFYSLSLLPPVWQLISKINPIVYMVSGFRYGFLGVTEVSLMVTFSVLIAFVITLYTICWYMLEKGVGLRQ